MISRRSIYILGTKDQKSRKNNQKTWLNKTEVGLFRSAECKVKIAIMNPDIRDS